MGVNLGFLQVSAINSNYFPILPMGKSDTKVQLAP